MIISFDGNVFSGKTYFINTLSKSRDFNPIAEHSFFIDKVSNNLFSSNKFLSQQKRYLEVDALRKKYIRESKINLIDRSFVSLSAHVLALFKCGIADIRTDYIKLLQKYLNGDRIIIPDYYVFIYSPLEISRRRFANDTKRGTEILYLDKNYFEAVELFNRKWVGLAPGKIIDKVNYKCLNIQEIDKNAKKIGKKEIILMTKEIFDKVL